MLRSWALMLLFASCACFAACDSPTATTVRKPIVAPNLDKPADISFGRRQVDQMLADRPDMVGILDKDDPIFLWVVDGMNGATIGQRVYWNSNTPESGSAAEHASPYHGYPPHIRISGGTEITGHDRWTCIVYELFNLENTRGFKLAYKKAIAGKMDGFGYATECARLEYVALQKAKEFFEKHPLPDTKPGFHEHYEQITETPATFEKYLMSYCAWDGTFEHPGQYFMDYYDDTIAPYRKTLQDAKKYAEGDSSIQAEPSEKKDTEFKESMLKETETLRLLLDRWRW